MNNNSTAPVMSLQSLNGAMWRKNAQPAGNVLLWWPVFLSCGIGVFFNVQYTPPIWLGLVAIAGILSLVTVTRRWRFETPWVWIMHGLFAIALGFTVMQMRHAMVETDLLNYPEFNIPISGLITDAEDGKSGWKVTLDQAQLTLPEKYRNKVTKQYRLRITTRGKDFTPVMGSHVSLRASLIAPSPPLLPGMFDFRRHAFYDEMSGYGYSNSPVTVLDKPAYSFYPLENYRHYIARRVKMLLGQTGLEPQNSVTGMTTAFLNGQRAGIDTQSQRDMQYAGLQHLISISGVHVSMLAAIVFFVTRFLLALNMRLALTWPIKKIAAGCALVAIILYMSVIGLSAPTVRSVLTTGVVLIAIMLDREAITLRLVAIAAIIILLCEPESLITPGFQMSFAAVIALVVFYQKTIGFWQHEIWRRSVLYRPLFVLTGSIATSLVATAATAPFVLYHFQQLPVLSVISNLLVTPVMTFIVMPGTLLAYLLLPFDTLGFYAVYYMGWGIAQILAVAHWTAAQDAALWRMNGVATWQVIAASVGALWMLLQQGRLIWFGLLPLSLAISGMLWVQQPILALIPTASRAIIYAPPDENIIYAEGKLDKFTKQLLQQYLKKDAVVAWESDKPPPKDVYIARDIPELETICSRPEKVIVSRWYIDQKCRGKTIIDRHALKRAREGIVVIAD